MDTRIKYIVDAVIAMVVLTLCIGAEAYIMIHGIPKEVDQILGGRILGTFDAIAITVVTWYFGSSRSSKEQVDAITSIGQAAASTPINIHVADGSVVRQTTPAAEVAAQQVHSHT